MTFVGGLKSILESDITSRANCDIGNLNVSGILDSGVLSIDVLGNIDKSGLDYIHERGGVNNFASGSNALAAITSGTDNTANGVSALLALTTGDNNTAIGENSLNTITTTSDNIAVGKLSGSDVTLSNNICIGHVGNAGVSQRIRIGTPVTHITNFQAGIVGVTTGVADAIPVLIDSLGQLGTVDSSIRYKTNVKSIKDSLNLLNKLRPVSFKYKKHKNSSRLQYGLIAEEVDLVLPDLVIRNKDHEIETIQYDKLYAFLISAIQELASEVALLKK